MRLVCREMSGRLSRHPELLRPPELLAVLVGSLQIAETEERQAAFAAKGRSFAFQRDLKRLSTPKLRRPVIEATPTRNGWDTLFPCGVCLGNKALGAGFKLLGIFWAEYLRGLNCYDQSHSLYELAGALTAAAIHVALGGSYHGRLSGTTLLLVGVAALAVAGVAPTLYPRFSRKDLLTLAFFTGFVKVYIVCWALFRVC
ncbi:MAG: uncharacterized protein KVP18_000377 [Porospora cf. gigantea A]|uniref:uncharacterized protein n=1 Tax=Porospora cf. gigantea A TaxID=2853593 RepID=UPI003559548E|nr:MAG: hypothetical protein KVP18_000377 [Porospora cf. gigantea A]